MQERRLYIGFGGKRIWLEIYLERSSFLKMLEESEETLHSFASKYFD